MRVAYVALNPVERKIRSGAMADSLPQTFRVATVPAGLSLRRAVTLPQGVETARRALGLLDVHDEDTVLVNGAAGSVVALPSSCWPNGASR